MADQKSPYPVPGSGESSKPQAPEEPARTEVDNSTLAPGVPEPQPGGPEKPEGAPPSSSDKQ